MIPSLIRTHSMHQQAREMIEFHYARDALIERYLDCMHGFDDSLLSVEEIAIAIELVRQNGVPFVDCCSEHWPPPDELMWAFFDHKNGGLQPYEAPKWLCLKCGHDVAVKWVQPVTRLPLSE